MHIKNNIVADFGDFELDTSAVGLCSLSDEDIKLPYTGVLPQQMSLATTAYIYLNVQVTQDVSAVLVVKLKTGKQIKRPLRISNAELISLLDEFFKQPSQSTGLSSYYLGLWWAHYIDWKKIVTGPNRLLSVISTFSINDKNYLKKHIADNISI